ncbi:hypothetical protein EW093_04600 [Thiospirochaeta perfilievii]|uniref:Lipoprotein n=1 Tax=Thiospirochaeta perfilievii TaxID=252967 RepID=A0A5C1QAR4_9SPIO|nr:hypothetical protein [Thiospirochaeta perfilievii]QEN04009.1 hypothetical protein EW093_04600 [Thiospirochaeta perfilievii]
MHNLFRKSIIIIAGLGLLFLYSCQTNPPSLRIQESVSIDNLFSDQRDSIIYVDFKENQSIINGVLATYNLDKFTKGFITQSFDVFLGLNSDIKSGFDGVLRGDFSRGKSEFGLFLSFSWKKVKDRGIKYWVNKDGVKIYFSDNNTIIFSSLDIVPIIKKHREFSLETPVDAILFIKPRVEDELTKRLSNGFIQGGVKSLKLSLNPRNLEYTIIGELGFETINKAKAFNRLLNLFFKFSSLTSNSVILNDISQNIEVRTENNFVVLENIAINEKIIVDFINNIIFLEGEADK